MNKIKENLQKLAQAKEAGFLYHGERIVESYRDKWAYLEDEKGEGSVHPIEYIIEDWEEHLQVLKEKEEAQNGTSVVVKYFQEHGVLGDKTIKNDRFNSCIIYDGYPTPGQTWNASIYMLGVKDHTINKNNRIGKSGFVNENELCFYYKEEDLMDASMQNGKPHLRHCHNWYTQPHTKYKEHYTREQWEQDKREAFDRFIKLVNKIVIDAPIQVSKNGMMYQEGQKFVFELFAYHQPRDYGWDSYRVQLNQFEIISAGKFRDRGLGISKMPNFISTKTREEFIAEVTQAYKDMEERSGANKEFKYK